MQFDRNQPVIVVPVLLVGLTGEVLAEMVLDTGATYTTISWGLAAALGYDPGVAQENVNLVTASGVEQAPVVSLEAVETLGIRVNQVKVACWICGAESCHRASGPVVPEGDYRVH